MIKYKHLSVFVIISIFFVANFLVVFAQQTPVNPGGDQTPVNPGSMNNGSVSLQNPLGNKTLIQFFQDILDVILVFAVPLIVFFIILAGFNYVMARGNESKVQSAHMALLYAVIGGLLILGAYVILEVISGTVDSFRY